MNLKEERLLIQYLLSSHDVFSRCVSIIDSSYFHPKLKPVVSYILDYYSKYRDIISTDILNAKFDIDSVPFVTKQIPKSEYKFACDNIELFCKQQAVKNAVLDSLGEVEKGNVSVLYDAIVKATAVSLTTDLGIDFYSDPLSIFEKMRQETVVYTTGIADLDARIGGGLFKKQLTLFSANSGGGKSVMLTNLAVNYSLQGLDVLYISLELPEDQIFLRAASILTNYPIKSWKENVQKYVSNIIQTKNNGSGSLRIKRLKGNACTNDIRSYLKQYELEHKKTPDVLVVDYLDKMTPDGGRKNLSVSEQDKDKSEQLAELMFDYDMIGISASQQTRDAIGDNAPTQAVIAGGITKVNTVDNYISIFMSQNMKLKGEMLIFFLKTRYSDGVGDEVMLKYSSSSLKITDMSGPMKLTSLLSERKKHIQHLIDSGLVTDDDDDIVNNNSLVKEMMHEESLDIDTNIEEIVDEDQFSDIVSTLINEDIDLSSLITS
jgi:hypothetical protein